MAYGFQDCCNLSSYFYLTGIPASVQENEIFKIETLQGETFCGTYVKVPPLNYSVPTYTVISLTEYSSCDDCEDLGDNPCPAEESIFLSQFGSGTVATSTDCYLKTIFPLYVDCSPSVLPTSEATSDGQLILYVIGGVPPYFFYSAGTFNTPDQQLFSSTPGATANSYLVLDGIAQGEYSITVTDAQGNFFEDVTCIIDAQPVPATLTCAGTVTPSMSFNGVGPLDGSVSINIAGGTPPYTVTIQGSPEIQTRDSDGVVTFTNLPAGSYTFTVTETAEPPFPASVTSLTCTINLGPEVFYPTNMCLSFLLCTQTSNIDKFYLNLIRDGSAVSNFRPVYKLTPQSAAKIGLLVNNTFRIGWINDTIGWGVVPGTSFTGTIVWNTEPNPNTCTFNSPLPFNLTSTFINGSVSFAQSTPTDFSWAGAPGLMNQATSVEISDSNCEVISYLDESTSQFFVCDTNSSSEVQIALGAVGGNGGPYTYEVFPPGGGLFSLSVNGNILTLNENNTAGTYTVYATDSSGAQSTNTTTFTLSFSCFGLSVTPNSTNICPNFEVVPGGQVLFTINISAPVSAGGPAPTIDYPITLYWRKTTVASYNTVVMSNSTTTITVPGSPNGTAASTAGNFGAGTYEFYIEDANGEVSDVQTVTLTEVPCETPPINNTSATVGFTDCTTGQGSVTFSWEDGALPVVITTQLLGPPSPLVPTTVNTNPYTLNLSPGVYQYFITDSNGNTSPIAFTTLIIPPPPAINIRIRTASALATAMDTNGEYQTGNPDYAVSYFNNTLFDVGNEAILFSVSNNIDPLGRDVLVRTRNNTPFAGPDIGGSSSTVKGIWRYPLLIEMFIDYTNNGSPLQGWFEIKTKVQTVYTSQVPAGLFNLDRLLVLKNYNNSNNLGSGYWNEYVWLNDVNYVNATGTDFSPGTVINALGYPIGPTSYFDFTPAIFSGNYPSIDGSFIGMKISNSPQGIPPTDYPKRKVDLNTFGDNSSEFCESSTVYSGENPWKWNQPDVFDNQNQCTAISNFYVNFQKVTSDISGLPTVNSNLVSVSNCKNYYTNFCAVLLDNDSNIPAFAIGTSSEESLYPFVDPPVFFEDTPNYLDAFDILSTDCDSYTSNITPSGLAWNQTGKDIYLENYNGTSVIERTFTFGSNDSPLTITGNIVGGINYSSVGLKLEWFAIYEAFVGDCCGGQPNLNNCQSAKGLQVEVIFHETNVPDCPGASIPQPVNYFFRDPNISTSGNLVGTQVTNYVASMKVQGSTSNRPNLFNHLQNLKIIDI